MQLPMHGIAEDGSNEGGAGDAMGSVRLIIRISQNCLNMSECNPLSLVTSRVTAG